MKMNRGTPPNPRMSLDAQKLITQLNDGRIEAGIKFSDLSSALGGSSGNFGDFFNMRSVPTLSKFLKYANQLGFDVVLMKRDNR
jgi:hypothetical protein